jgi:hypothetical protein
MAGAVSRSLQTAMSSEGREPGAVQYSCIQTITYYLLESLLPSPFCASLPPVGRSWIGGSASAGSGIWLDLSDVYGAIAALQLASLVQVILGNSYSL